MKTQEVQEVQEVPETMETIEEPQYDQNFSIKKVNEMVQEYVEEKGTSPFVDVAIDDDNDGQLKVDIDKEFEQKLQDTFGLFMQETIGDYFSFLIKSVIQDLEELDLEDIVDPVDPTAPKESEKN